uniref:Tenomodulin n=1 Tax=Pogona vitticeps TaxID=103695 RepID=A0A6J0UAW2_9SAUR
MAREPQETSLDVYVQDVQASEKKELCRRYQLCGVLLCTFVLSLILTVLGVCYFWKQSPQKIYSLEHTFFGNGEKQKIFMKIDSLARTEVFHTGEGSKEVLEIHDFKNGITGIFFVGDPKCFIRSQIKGIPETPAMEVEETEGEETAATYFEQSVVWVPAEKPVENKDFLKNSKIFDFCKNVTVYWIHPTLLREAEVLDFEDERELEGPISTNQQDHQEVHHLAEEASPGRKRQARQLTEEDLPVNDYTENGLEFHPLWDERGYCCARCRRAHRYCQRVCEPLLGYYPYPYCYQGGRVICRVIMPCNWWVARMLGRV